MEYKDETLVQIRQFRERKGFGKKGETGPVRTGEGIALNHEEVKALMGAWGRIWEAVGEMGGK